MDPLVDDICGKDVTFYGGNGVDLDYAMFGGKRYWRRRSSTERDLRNLADEIGNACTEQMLKQKFIKLFGS